MIHDALEMKWQISRGKISRWWNKRSSEQDFKVESRRERLIKVLQKRYGYSKEKAVAELDTTYSKARLS